MTTHIPANIDEIPADVDQIYALLGQQPDQTAEDPPETATEGSAADDKSAEPVNADAKPVAPAITDDKADKLVPLSAVFAERDKARSLRERLAGAQARLEELERAQADGKSAAEGEVGFSPEEINEIEEAFPAIGKGLRTLASRLERMEVENREIKADKIGRERVAEEDARTEAQQSALEAISGVPKLDALDKSLSVEAWNARVAPIDDQLRADPEFSKLPTAERLAKVVEIYEYRYGPVAVAASQKAPQQTAAQKAAAAVKAAPAIEPSTLSDIPGGSVPDSPERDLERMNVHDIANMSKDDLDRLISKLG